MPYDKDFECSQARSSPSLTNTVAMLALGSFIASLDPNRFSPVSARGLVISAADLVQLA